VVFGAVLLVADRLGSKQRKISEFRWQDALIIGVAQALALIPGTSRAGITMTAALIMGGDRSAAARFSFLLSIPVILAAGTQQSFELVRAGAEAEVYWPVFVVGVIVAATSAWLVLKLFMHWIERAGMLPFVLYRVILGVWIFVWLS
jgi:undecaprenyl-diphosphatase